MTISFEDLWPNVSEGGGEGGEGGGGRGEGEGDNIFASLAGYV